MPVVKKNLKFSKEKITIRQNAKVTGLGLGANPERNVAMKPDIKRVEALLNIQSPNNKKEVVSLIGLLSTFNK